MNAAKNGRGSPRRILSQLPVSCPYALPSWPLKFGDRVEGDMLVREYFECLAKRRKRVRRSVKKKPSPPVATRGIGCGRRNERHRTVPSGRTAKLAWEPPRGSWEHEPFHIDGCEGDSAGTLMIYITWLGGHKTRHKVDVLCKKCPQKVRMSWFHSSPALRDPDNLLILDAPLPRSVCVNVVMTCFEHLYVSTTR